VKKPIAESLHTPVEGVQLFIVQHVHENEVWDVYRAELEVSASDGYFNSAPDRRHQELLHGGFQSRGTSPHSPVLAIKNESPSESPVRTRISPNVLDSPREDHRQLHRQHRHTASFPISPVDDGVATSIGVDDGCSPQPDAVTEALEDHLSLAVITVEDESSGSQIPWKGGDPELQWSSHPNRAPVPGIPSLDESNEDEASARTPSLAMVGSGPSHSRPSNPRLIQTTVIVEVLHSLASDIDVAINEDLLHPDAMRAIQGSAAPVWYGLFARPSSRNHLQKKVMVAVVEDAGETVCSDGWASWLDVDLGSMCSSTVRPLIRIRLKMVGSGRIP